MKRMIMALIMAAGLAMFPLLAQAGDGGSQSGGNNGGSQGGSNAGSQQNGGNSQEMENGNGTHDQKGFGSKVGGFVDEDGDGFNDLAPDEDGDGIPNGLDPDYQAPKDGTGNQFGKGHAIDEESLTGYRAWFAYLLAPMTSLPGAMEGFGPHGETKTTQGSFGQGPGDGTGLGGDSPGGGTGFGPGGTTGDCDGSGPNRPDSNNNNGRNQQGGRH